jgi:hypothetical protein
MRVRAGFLAAFLAGALGACTTATPHRHRVVDIDVRPPPARVIVVPARRPGYVWAPGYWRWDGRHHAWVDGVWIRERRGFFWVPAHWEERRGRWHFEAGHWARR